MDYASILARGDGAPLRAGLVGVGEFGASFLFRGARTPGLRVPAAADPDLERVVRAATRAGVAEDRIARCDTAAEALAAYERRLFVATRDAEVLVALPLDFVVEATGAPESAARIATLAIAAGKHVAMVSKECDSVVGPILQVRAAAAGVVCTAVDGDQPSLAIGLVTWARTLGLDVVCAGKASEYDFVLDLERETVSAIGRTLPAPGMRRLWSVPPRELRACVERRAAILAAWPHKTVPDLCELGIIANATELVPDTPALHAPIARTLELPDLLRPALEGGQLQGMGRLDTFNCLRRADEISFAGGVFVVVRCDDPATWEVLRGKGIPTSADGSTALLHNPVHLLGIEAPLTLFGALAFGKPAGKLTPRFDLVARTRTKLSAGTCLSLGERHAITDMEPLLQAAQAVRNDAPAPYYMAAGQTLRVDVPAGEVLRREHLVAPRHSILWTLRDEQDVHFFG
jgi:predicted homoserine dehydrogenase-like protein